MREFIRRALQKTARMNTEQMQSLLSLITEEYELLDAVLDSISTGVVVCDTFHIMVQNNKAASRILPMESYDAQDRPVWTNIRDPDIAEFVHKTIENQDTVISKEFLLEDLSFSRYISISVLPLVRSKRVRGTVITIEDITEKRNEEMRHRRLESLASLTNLAASVAHEIKNPLGSISIYVQLIRKNLRLSGKEVSPENIKYLDIVDEEIERLNKIVVDFLFAVRPLKFEFVSLDFNAMIRSLGTFFTEELNQAGISLRLDLSEDLPFIKGDERFLRQMMINLVKNAMAAMISGGIIEIKTWLMDDFVNLSIEDTGSGIPEDELHKIFEPYFTTKVDGTGLGLTMTYKVVKEHGGDIRVQSEKNKGTCFTISLPVLRRAQKMLEYEEYKKT